jgi:hypothetical protein
MKPMDRRQFLTAAGVASAALAQGSPAKIKTGILCIQHSHLSEKLKVMHNNPDFEVVAACEPDEGTRSGKGASPLLQGLKWVSLDDMLSDTSLDLIAYGPKIRLSPCAGH